MSFHAEKLKSALIELTAEFLNRRATPQSLITVLDCELRSDGHEAQLVVSVFPPDQGATALAFLKRQRGDLREYLQTKVRGGAIPRVDFVLASSDK